jgi:hypothetical protein
VKKSAGYVKTFYDLDLIVEQSIRKWHATATEDDTIRKAMKPFMEWLDTAEEESEEE